MEGMGGIGGPGKVQLVRLSKMWKYIIERNRFYILTYPGCIIEWIVI